MAGDPLISRLKLETLLIADRRKQLQIEVDHAVARPMGLIEYHPAPVRFFLQASFSLTESDETRRGAIPRSPDRPQRARLRISATDA